MININIYKKKSKTSKPKMATTWIDYSTGTDNSGIGYYSISGALSSNFTSGVWEKAPMQEDDKIEVTLLDGTKEIMTLKDYFQFIAYHKMIPSDCKDKSEFNEKMMVFRL